jgi:hypothetical protein
MKLATGFCCWDCGFPSTGIPQFRVELQQSVADVPPGRVLLPGPSAMCATCDGVAY